ncbi:hypothetical protein [Chelativorans sp. Marseille-P2723]|uniref:hypothetical protein n=1 Tax=Chelativorans sp. Marseille-P2723 TaxID=2709133 RepID=UPI00156D95F6|nr:hypothetical protein [Chelativorans sp. Marseille-P2723]
MQGAARPYAALKIDELAAEFIGARNYGDVKRLKALDDELTRRKSRRARALSAHVSLALASAAKRAA